MTSLIPNPTVDHWSVYSYTLTRMLLVSTVLTQRFKVTMTMTELLEWLKFEDFPMFNFSSLLTIFSSSWADDADITENSRSPHLAGTIWTKKSGKTLWKRGNPENLYKNSKISKVEVGLKFEFRPRKWLRHFLRTKNPVKIKGILM